MPKYLDETGLAHFWGNVKQKMPFYDATLNGCAGDGQTDDYTALQEILTTLNDIGGILFLPAGTYNISKSLTVGSNTVMLGVGPKSYINLTQSGNLMGTAITVAGSNVIIDSISGGYVDDDRPFNTTGANMGFIGIGAYTFDSCKALNEGEIGLDGLVSTDYHNVTVRNLYCESTYPLQTEPANNGTIDNVTYDKIVCPYGAVSMYNNYDGAIKNAVINDVKCAFLRIGAGSDDSFINVSNIYCNILRGSSRKVNYSNIFIRYDEDSVVRDWVTAGTFAYTELLYMQDSNLSNCLIDACGADIVGFAAVSVVNDDARYDHISNVVVKNVNSPSNAAVKIGGNDTHRYTICTNCDFSQNETAGNYLSGVFIGCKLGTVNPSESSIYSDTRARIITFTFATGIEGASSYDSLGSSTYTYDKAHLRGTIYNRNGNLANGMELFTINARHAPSAAQVVRGLAWSSTDNSFTPCVIDIDTDGVAKIRALLKSGTYNRLTIDDEYVVGVLDK